MIFVYTQLEQEQTEEMPEEKKVTRLAIGVQGGFDADPLAKKYETRENYSVVILPQLLIVPWPNDALPDKVR
jgi:ubiquitin carboxyl-terminal hydrolase 5/13